MTIAAVTSAICEVLRVALVEHGAFQEARITHLPLGDPQLDAGPPTVNVALVAAEPAAELRRQQASGGPMLSLAYIVSGHGDHAALEPQRLLSAAAVALHENPVLKGAGRDLSMIPQGSGRDVPGRPAVSLLYSVPGVTIGRQPGSISTEAES